MGNTINKNKNKKTQYMLKISLIKTKKRDNNVATEYKKGDTVLILNNNIVAWSYGYIIDIKDNKLWIIDIYDSILRIMDVASSAVKKLSYQSDGCEPKITFENDRYFAKSLGVFENNVINYNYYLNVYTEKLKHPELCKNINISKTSNPMEIHLDKEIIVLNNSPPDPIKLYLNKEIMIFVKNLCKITKNKSIERGGWTKGWIIGINIKAIQILLFLNGHGICIINVDKKYSYQIREPNHKNIDLFVPVKTKTSEYQCIIDISGDMVLRSGDDDYINISNVEPYTYDMDYINKLLTGDGIDKIKVYEFQK